MLLSIVLMTACIGVVCCVALYIFQAKLIYFPTPHLDATPHVLGLPYEDVTLRTDDGITIHGWFLPHPSPRATLLFFHGNAGNISHRLDSLRLFHNLRLAVLIIDYHGYGQSGGRPSEHGTYLDAKAAWEYLVTTKHLAPETVIIFGRSLGGAVAAWLGSQHKAGAVILESTFTSMTAMGRYYYPYLPVTLLARIRYPSLARIPHMQSPLLIIHSPTDDIVPYQFGQQLFHAAQQPKTFLQISGGHNDGALTSGAQYIAGIEAFLTPYIGR